MNTDTLNNDKSRAEFEAHYGPRDSFAWRNTDDTYKVQALQSAWEVWQAAQSAALARQAIAAPDFTAHAPECSNWGCTGCADPDEVARLLAAPAATAVPTESAVHLLNEAHEAIAAIANGHQDGEEIARLMCKKLDAAMPALLASPAATAAPTDSTTIVQDVADLFRAAGFEVRECGSALDPRGQFAIAGSLDAAGVLVNAVIEHFHSGAERFDWSRKGMVLSPDGFYVHHNRNDDRKLDASPAATAAPKVPEGYKLVPLEPTGVMKDAGAFSGLPVAHAGETWTAARVYRAMLAAAPAAPEATVPAAAEVGGLPPLPYRTCCDHPDCTTCAGHGGYYRMTGPAPHQEAEGSGQDAKCSGCDPAEGFCRQCREAERAAMSASPATPEQDTK